LGRSRLAALLAALAFGYGGLTTNALGMNGLMTNALMWLPLVLVALERARTRSLAGCTAGAGAAYALSVLTGLAQGFLLVAYVAAAYALFLALVPAQAQATRAVMEKGARGPESVRARTRRKLTRWRPAFVAAGAFVVGAGVAAFQLLETWRAARRSIRHEITYEFFSQGSLTLREALLSCVAPLYHYIDATTYVAPLACALALYAVARALRRKETNPRARFWLVAAGLAFIFMLGAHTPLYRLAYRVPVLNLFRVPERLTFVWTFAISVLAAYGWDALRNTYAARRRIAAAASEHRRIFIAVALLALSALVGAFWFLSVNRVAVFGLLPATQHGRAYLAWKLAFTAGVLLVVWCAHHLGAARWRAPLLAGALLLGCMCEPLILISQWWPGTAKPAARFTTPGRATTYLQQFAPEQHRV